jgi:ketosteroid isomerase-like protein
MDIYINDAILVVMPRTNALDKAAILEAFKKIAVYFKNGLQVKQNGMAILESGDIALVLANTVISGPNYPATERKATYIFNRSADGTWLCSIDNSYGHDAISTKS